MAFCLTVDLLAHRASGQHLDACDVARSWMIPRGSSSSNIATHVVKIDVLRFMQMGMADKECESGRREATAMQ